MKRNIMPSAILSFLLATAAASASAAGTEELFPETDIEMYTEESSEMWTEKPEEKTSDEYSFDLPAAGVGFDLPEELQDMQGSFQSVYGVEVEDGSGIWLSGLLYFAFPEEKYEELAAKGQNLTEEDTEFLAQRMMEVLLVYTVAGDLSEEDMTDTLLAYGLPAEGMQEIGEVEGYRYFYLANPLADVLDSRFTFDEGFREEFERVIEICEDPSWIRTYEPRDENVVAEGTVISFETTDLDGNPVRSADIFSKNKITMINLWGTFCGPCIGEMPDLEILNQRLAEKGCGIIGIVTDVGGADDSAQIDIAKSILDDAGVTYLNLVPWTGIWTDLPAQYIPTSYFVDSEGRILGEPAVGARGADEYEALFDR